MTHHISHQQCTSNNLQPFFRPTLVLRLLQSNWLITSSVYALLSQSITRQRYVHDSLPLNYISDVQSFGCRGLPVEMVRHIEIESSLSEDENIGTTARPEIETDNGKAKNVDTPFKPGKEIDGEALMQRVIAKANAGSEDENGMDDDMNFGEEEEDDGTEPPPPDEVEAATSTIKASASSTTANPDDRSPSDEVIAPSDDEIDPDDDSVPPSNAEPTKPAGRKRGRAKPTESSPTKAAKKSNADAAGKGSRSKTAITKKKAATVASNSSEKVKGKVVKASKSSASSDAKTSGSVEKTPARPKSRLSKTAKASTKEEADEGTDVKPKKTITKPSPSKLGGRKLVKTPTKTYSKKEAAAATKRSTSEKKSTPVKLAASMKKSNASSKSNDKKKTTPKKRKGAKQQSDEEEEEEDNVNVVDGADGDSEVESPPTQGEEVTSLGKGSLGNIACSTRDNNAQSLLDHAVQQLGQYRIVDYSGNCDTPLSAYIVGKGTKRGWGLLRALAAGVPLVSETWLSTSISDGKWADMDGFHTDRFGQSPRPVDGAGSVSRILDGMRVKVSCEAKEAANVRKLVTVCGGRVAETRVDLVINDTKKVVDGAVNVEKKWLADSIEAGVAIEFEPYVVGKAPS